MQGTEVDTNNPSDVETAKSLSHVRSMLGFPLSSDICIDRGVPIIDHLLGRNQSKARVLSCMPLFVE